MEDFYNCFCGEMKLPRGVITPGYGLAECTVYVVDSAFSRGAKQRLVIDKEALERDNAARIIAAADMPEGSVLREKQEAYDQAAAAAAAVGGDEGKEGSKAATAAAAFGAAAPPLDRVSGAGDGAGVESRVEERDIGSAGLQSKAVLCIGCGMARKVSVETLPSGQRGASRASIAKGRREALPPYLKVEEGRKYERKTGANAYHGRRAVLYHDTPPPECQR